MSSRTNPDSKAYRDLLKNQLNSFTTKPSTLHEGGKATLSIYDVSGKLLKEIVGEYSQGMNVESIQQK